MSAAPVANPLCSLGSHRVIAPAGALPQNAWKIDNAPVPHANEILCEVETLNIDSASFTQMSERAAAMRSDRAHILDTVQRARQTAQRVTGSGGMFVGRVLEIGRAAGARRHRGRRPHRLARLAVADAAAARRGSSGRCRDRPSPRARQSDSVRERDLRAAARRPADRRRAGRPRRRRRAGTGPPADATRRDRLRDRGRRQVGDAACAQARERAGAGGRVVGIVPDAETEARGCWSSRATSTS